MVKVVFLTKLLGVQVCSTKMAAHGEKVWVGAGGTARLRVLLGRVGVDLGFLARLKLHYMVVQLLRTPVCLGLDGSIELSLAFRAVMVMLSLIMHLWLLEGTRRRLVLRLWRNISHSPGFWVHLARGSILGLVG